MSELKYIKLPIQKKENKRGGTNDDATFLITLRRLKMFKWLFRKRRSKELTTNIKKTKQLVELQGEYNDLLREENEIVEENKVPKKTKK